MFTKLQVLIKGHSFFIKRHPIKWISVLISYFICIRIYPGLHVYLLHANFKIISNGEYWNLNLHPQRKINFNFNLLFAIYVNLHLFSELQISYHCLTSYSLFVILATSGSCWTAWRLQPSNTNFFNYYYGYPTNFFKYSIH